MTRTRIPSTPRRRPQVNAGIRLAGMAALLLFALPACTTRTYRDGPPIIVKKQQSLLPGKCLYTYEGYGREEMFDDDCAKYNVGDTLK